MSTGKHLEDPPTKAYSLWVNGAFERHPNSIVHIFEARKFVSKLEGGSFYGNNFYGSYLGHMEERTTIRCFQTKCPDKAMVQASVLDTFQGNQVSQSNYAGLKW